MLQTRENPIILLVRHCDACVNNHFLSISVVIETVWKLCFEECGCASRWAALVALWQPARDSARAGGSVGEWDGA